MVAVAVSSTTAGGIVLASIAVWLPPSFRTLAEAVWSELSVLVAKTEMRVSSLFSLAVSGESWFSSPPEAFGSLGLPSPVTVSRENTLFRSSVRLSSIGRRACVLVAVVLLCCDAFACGCVVVLVLVVVFEGPETVVSRYLSFSLMQSPRSFSKRLLMWFLSSVCGLGVTSSC